MKTTKTSSAPPSRCRRLAARPWGRHRARSADPEWSFGGLFGTFDRASAQRGFQVYQEVSRLSRPELHRFP